MAQRPSRGVWVAWAVALAGGIAVLVAAVVAVRLELGTACASACAGRASLATGLVYAGTALAVLGAATATVLTVRRFTRQPRS